MTISVTNSLGVKLDSATYRKLDRMGDEFLAAVLRFETDRRTNVSALFELGAVLTRLGDYEEGLSVDRRLVKFDPRHPVLRYNLACSLALLQKIDEAILELEAAVQNGYNDLEHLLRDRDLKNLQNDGRFEALVKKLRREVEAKTES